MPAVALATGFTNRLLVLVVILGTRDERYVLYLLTHYVVVTTEYGVDET